MIQGFATQVLGLEHGPAATELGTEPEGPARRLALIVGAPLVHALLGFPLDRAVANPLTSAPAWVGMAGTAVFVLGLALMLWASAQMWAVGWRPLTTRAPETLLTTGAFGLVRHPWYFGGSLAFLGGAVALGSFWTAALGWPMFNLFLLALATGAEDRVLHARFGPEWEAYASRVRPVWPGPGGAAVVGAVEKALATLSSVVNRPLVVRLGKDHLLFLSYGAGQGIGAGFTLLLIKFLLWDRHPGFEADLIIALCVIPGVLGNRVAGIASLVFGEGLSLREALGKVRFIAWGMLAGLFGSVGLISLFLWQSPFVILDVMCVGLMPAHFLGRLGCVFYGCCHGRPTQGGFGIEYHHELTKPIWNLGFERVRVFPTQLFSATYGLVILAVVLGMWSVWSLPVGVPTCVAAILFGLFRFNEEWFRYGSGAGWQAMSFGQFYGLGMVALGVGVLWGLVPLTTDTWPPLDAGPLLDLLTPSGLVLPVLVTVLVTTIYGYHRGRVGAL